MSQITTYVAIKDGVVVTMGAAASGDTAEVGEHCTLLVTNGDASSKTVTIAVPGNLDSGDAYPDKVITIAAGVTKAIPLLPLYRDPTSGLAVLTWSATTSVTRAVIRR